MHQPPYSHLNINQLKAIKHYIAQNWILCYRPCRSIFGFLLFCLCMFIPLLLEIWTIVRACTLVCFCQTDCMWRYFIKPSNQYIHLTMSVRVCVLCRFAVKYRNYLYFEFLCVFDDDDGCVLNFNIAERGRISKYLSHIHAGMRMYAYLSLYLIILYLYHKRRTRARATHDKCATNEFN